MRLTNWRVTRSGARLVVHGTNADTGEPDKLTRVDEVAPAREGGHRVAEARVGTDYHELLLG